MKKYLLSMVAFVVTLFLFTACSKLPQAEIDAASAAVKNVQLSEAEVYAAESYRALNDSLNLALNLVETKNSKLFKNFDEPKQMLLKVEAMAMRVKSEAEAGKQSIIAEVNNMLNETAKLNIENEQLLSNAPKGKEGRLAIESIKTDINAVNSHSLETRDLIEQNKIMDAKTKAQLNLQKARGLNDEIKKVIAKSSKA